MNVFKRILYAMFIVPPPVGEIALLKDITKAVQTFDLDDFELIDSESINEINNEINEKGEDFEDSNESDKLDNLISELDEEINNVSENNDMNNDDSENEEVSEKVVEDMKDDSVEYIITEEETKKRKDDKSK